MPPNNHHRYARRATAVTKNGIRPPSLRRDRSRFAIRKTTNRSGKMYADSLLSIASTMQTSDEIAYRYPRHPIDVGKLTFSYEETGNGKYFYKYTLDNRLVQMIRVGEFDHSFGPGVPRRLGQPILRGPDGWTSLGVGWVPSWTDPVTRSETA